MLGICIDFVPPSAEPLLSLIGHSHSLWPVGAQGEAERRDGFKRSVPTTVDSPDLEKGQMSALVRKR